MEIKQKSIKLVFPESTFFQNLLWGGLLGLCVATIIALYKYFPFLHIEPILKILYFWCPIMFVLDILVAFFLKKKSGALSEKNSILKKMFVHFIGWPLFVAAVIFSFIIAAFTGWTVQFFSDPEWFYELSDFFSDFPDTFTPLTDRNRPALVFFIGSTAIFSFLSTYIFATFILKGKILKIIVSSLIALSCSFFLLWWAYENIAWGFNRRTDIGCALGINPGHIQQCVTMTKEERKQYMKDNDITEKDLEKYRKRYLEKK